MYEEIYNRHYITTRSDGAIIDAWSDGPNAQKDISDAVCINEKGGYQLRLMVTFAEVHGEPYHMRTEENPPIYTMDGIPIYKWDGRQVIPRSEADIQAEIALIPPPPPSELEKLRADVDFIALLKDIPL